MGPGRWCAVSDFDEEDKYLDMKCMADSSALLVLKLKKKKKKKVLCAILNFRNLGFCSLLLHIEYTCVDKGVTAQFHSTPHLILPPRSILHTDHMGIKISDPGESYFRAAQY